MATRRSLAVLICLAIALSMPIATVAAKKGGSAGGALTGPTCELPASNADGLEILSTYYPGYWWDHTHLTVAVQSHPKVKAPRRGGT